jgi:hypothetical protein
MDVKSVFLNDYQNGEVATKMFHWSKLSKTHIQAKESLLWLEASSKILVWKTDWVSDQQWVQ